MQLAMIGTGYVGLVSAACFAELGYRIACVDQDAEKIERLKRGQIPLYEPGLEELVTRHRADGRLHFTTDTQSAVSAADIVFLAVGTPASEHDGLPDLSQLEAAVAQAARAMREDALLVIKSTVPVGTNAQVAARVKAFRPGARIAVVSNPEFLRQGAAVKDFLHPDRVVIGVDAADSAVRERMEALYAPLAQTGVKLVTVSRESAEIIKYAANTMLAARIAFINEIADLCEKLGGDVGEVSRAVGLDHRIGEHFLQAGPGFGGSCFPKDAQALAGIAAGCGVRAPLVSAVIESNLRRKDRMNEKILNALGGDASGKTVCILGLTFKPGTDDLRESISLSVLPALLEAGARVRAYDPQGMENARKIWGDAVHFCPDAYDAAKGADACVVLTEWAEFRTLELARLKAACAAPVMVDLRNVFSPASARAAGFTYYSIGR